jgi:hypothetical protein
MGSGPPTPPPPSAATFESASESELAGSLPAASNLGPPTLPAPLAAKGEASSRGHASLTARGASGGLSCGPFASATDICANAWLAPQRLLVASSTVIAGSADPSSTTRTDLSTGGGSHGRSTVGSPPVSPAPSAPPSGSSGAAAAGGSGLALSGFLTLAGLLLLAAPRAMRRLRLSSQPWLTACFALIPERPG